MSIGTGDEHNKITFGGYDVDKFATGPINWHKIDKYENYWQLKMQNFSFKGKQNWATKAFANKEIIVDSGTSMILMPSKDMQTMFNIIENEVGIGFPKVKNLPRAACT